MWRPLPLEPMPDTDAGELVGALLPADSPLSEGQKRRRLPAKPAAARSFWSNWPATPASTGWSRAAGPRLPRCSTRGSARLSPDARRFLETLAICGRPMAPELICAACGIAREQAAAGGDAPVRLTSFAAAARRSGSRRITIGSARCLPPGSPPTPCAGSTVAWCKRSSRREATTARRCSSTIRAPAIPRTRRFRPALPPRKRALRSPSTGPRSSTGTRWRWRPPHRPRRRGREGLANALANAGRPAEAADAYLRAAAGAGHPQRVELQRRAAEQFLIGGHIDRGLELIRAMLAGMGMRMPGSPRTALLSLLWRRARLRWRGLRFVSEARRTTSTRIRSCAWTPAGRRRRDCSWST